MSDAIVALHVDPELSVGRIGHRSGVLTAACQEVRIVIRGVGGHAARPHLAVDPIAVAGPAREQPVPGPAPFGRLARSQRRDLRQHPGRHQPERHPRRGRAEGDDPDLERSRGRAGRGADHPDRARSVRGQRAATIDVDVPTGARRPSYNDPEVTAVCVQAARQVVGAGERRRDPAAQHGRRGFLGLSQACPGLPAAAGRGARSTARVTRSIPLTSTSTRAR